MIAREISKPPQGTVPWSEFEEVDGYSQYLLHAPSEILAVIRSVVQKGAMTTVHFDGGKSFFLTSILSLSPDNRELIFDCSNDEDTNRQAIKASKLTFATFIDKVKVQFSTNGLRLIHDQGRPAFVAAVPVELLRLQRREFFRLSAPIANPIKLRATLRSTTQGAWQLEGHLLDISGGGVGLVVTPTDAAYLDENETLVDCKMVLPDEGVISVDLNIRNRFEVVSKTGTRHLRIGCEFVDLPPSKLNAIQRYITRIERERKARLNGLA